MHVSGLIRSSTRLLVQWAGAIAAGLGLGVIIELARETGAGSLDASEYTSMRPQSAICFVVQGASLVLWSFGRRRIATLLCALVAVLALSLGLHQVASSGYAGHLLAHLGSPFPSAPLPPNMALLFGLTSIAVVVLESIRRPPGAVVASVLSASALALAASSLVGYLVGTDAVRRWGSAPPMSVQSALGILLVSAAVLLVALIDPETKKFRCLSWLPLPTAVAGIILSLCMWHALADLKGNEGLLQRLEAFFSSTNPIDRNLPELALATALALVVATTLAVHLGQRLATRSRERGRALQALQKTHQELKRANSELEYQVRLRTAEISQVNGRLKKEIVARRRLEQRLRNRARSLADAHLKKDEFLAILSHELRNPLAAIALGLESWSLDDPNAPMPPETRAVMKERLQYIIRLVDDLLDVSRIARGKIALQKTTVNLATIVTRAVESLRPSIEQRGHSVSIAMPRHPLFLEADSVRLEQIISNLVSNAVKFTPPRGEIAISARRDRDDVVLSVKDNGVGIASELLPRIFDPFTQGRRNFGKKQGGIGVGLTLVQRLTALHRGTVEALSDGPDTGSEFVVRFPASRRALGRGVTDRDPAATGRKAARRVLIVEDQVDLAGMTQRLIAAWGHQTKVEPDPLRALVIAEAFDPDVALVDVGLPGMNGYEVAKRLRARSSRLLLVAVSGFGQDEGRRCFPDSAAAECFDHYLMKPVDLNVLKEILESSTPAV